MPRGKKAKVQGKGMRRPRRGRGNNGNSQGARNNNGNRPTLVLRPHLLITQNVTSVNLKQINVIPTLSLCNPSILEQVKNF